MHSTAERWPAKEVATHHQGQRALARPNCGGAERASAVEYVVSVGRACAAAARRDRAHTFPADEDRQRESPVWLRLLRVVVVGHLLLLSVAHRCWAVQHSVRCGGTRRSVGRIMKRVSEDLRELRLVALVGQRCVVGEEEVTLQHVPQAPRPNRVPHGIGLGQAGGVCVVVSCVIAVAVKGGEHQQQQYCFQARLTSGSVAPTSSAARNDMMSATTSAGSRPTKSTTSTPTHPHPKQPASLPRTACGCEAPSIYLSSRQGGPPPHPS